MRNIFILMLLLTMNLSAFGQISNEKELYGKWKVEKIIENPTSPQFQPLIDGFKNSCFIFNLDGNFELTTTSNSELFGMVTDMTNGTKWKFELNNQYVKIGNDVDGYSIMGISVYEIDGKRIFHLDESEITLEMKKAE